MQFDPVTKEEAESAGLLPDGWYVASVETAKDQTSAGGKDMIALGLKIYRNGETPREMTDFLMGHAMRHKLRHFCEATGQPDKADAGTLEPEDCVGKVLWAKVGTQGARRDDKTGKEYGPRNQIRDYMGEKDAAAEEHGAVQPDSTDGLPF